MGDLPAEEQRIGLRLNPLQKEILRLADDARGQIEELEVNQISGTWFRVGSKSFVDDDDPAVAAEARDAIEGLQTLGLVRHEGGIIYRLTGAGHRIARHLKQSQPE